MDSVVLVEKQEHICTVSINRPEKRNAINVEVAQRLIEVFGSIKVGGDVRVVVLRGAGEQSFCAGADLEAMAGREGGGSILQSAIQAVVDCPCPVIAMIYGYAVGAGCDLAVACDLRVIGESARIGINPVKLGLVYFPQSLERFVSLVGVGYTKELFLTGKFFTAERAKEMGLVNYVVPEARLASFSYELASEIANNAPLAVSGTKSILNRFISRKMTPDEIAELREIMEASWKTEDAREGITAFLQRRKPEFQGK